MKCLICLDSIDNIEFLPCSHGFHINCINEWINAKPYCPICKIPISIKTPEELDIYNNDKNILDSNNIRKNNLYQRISELTNRQNNNTTGNQTEETQTEDILEDDSGDDMLSESFSNINIELQNILEFEHNFNNKYYNNFNGFNDNVISINNILNLIQNNNNIIVPINRIEHQNNVSNFLNRVGMIYRTLSINVENDSNDLDDIPDLIDDAESAPENEPENEPEPEIIDAEPEPEPEPDENIDNYPANGDLDNIIQIINTTNFIIDNISGIMSDNVDVINNTIAELITITTNTSDIIDNEDNE